MEYRTEINKSIKYIENNLCEELKLKDIAMQSNFSEFYFDKLFRRFTGVSAMEYVRRRRLTEAALDLGKTSEKITDIAFKYQFSSEESFSRAFRKAYGISPRKYRDNVNIMKSNENIKIFINNSGCCPSSSEDLSLSMAA